MSAAVRALLFAGVLCVGCIAAVMPRFAGAAGGSHRRSDNLVSAPFGTGAAAGPATLPDYGYLNVRAYGAAADGTTDDTGAFVAALAAAANLSAGVVFAPAGTYCIRGVLTVPANTVLKGANEYPFRSWGTAGGPVAGTTLLAFAGKGNASAPAFVSLQGANAGVVGLNIFYPEQNMSLPAPLVYPPAIQGAGDDVTVKNVLLVNPYFGIDFGTHPCGRHLIEGVYGQPLSVGIFVDQCYDIGRIKSIHFWPFWAPLKTPAIEWQHNNAITLDLRRTDWEIVEDVFSFAYHTGIRFTASTAGACNGQFTDINFDDVDIGVDITDTQDAGVFFSNLNLANAGDGQVQVGIRGNAGGSGKAVVRGASFWGQFKQAVQWNNAGYFAMSNSMVNNWHKDFPAVQATAGRVSITETVFKDKIGAAIDIASSVDRAIVTNNDLVGNKLTNGATDSIVNNNLP